LIENSESKEILILQPHMINNLESKFGDEVKNKRVYKTPGTPRFKIVCPENDDDIIEPNLQNRYRSGVGMLLYLLSSSILDLICARLLGVAKVYGQVNNGDLS
jgi:hypothetical protein